jgi:hypothetical protein
MKLHPHAAGLVAIVDPDWRRKIWLGGLLLLTPVLGWPALVGYRSRFVPRLLGSEAPLLPVWRGEIPAQVRDGLKALAVIFGYQLPLFVALVLIAASRGWVPSANALWLCAFFVAWPIFSTLSFRSRAGRWRSLPRSGSRCRRRSSVSGPTRCWCS